MSDLPIDRPTHLPRGRRYPYVGPLVLLAVVAAAVDGITPVVMASAHEAFWPAVFMGLLASQLGLLATWAVLGPGRPLVRLVACLLAAEGLAGILMAGILAVERPHISGEEFRQLGCMLLMLPAVFLAAQCPVWVLRVVAGCRMAVSGEGDVPADVSLRQFRLVHLILATGGIALCFGLAKLGMTVIDRFGPRNGETQMWLRLGITCLVVALWSAAFTLPVVTVVFALRKKFVVVGIMILAAVVLGTTIVVLAVLEVFGGYVDDEEVAAMFAFNAILAASLWAGLSLLKANETVLVWPWRPAAVPLEAEDPPGSPFQAAAAEASPFGAAGSPEEASGEGETELPDT